MRFVVILTCLGHVALAQAPAPRAADATATVSGVVRDSVAHQPLGGAQVQIVSANPAARFGRLVTADSLGRFAFDSVPRGRYMLGFIHPVLDSLGVEAPVRDVAVDGEPVRVALSTPSAARLRTAVCGPTASDSSALVAGTVRGATDGNPVSGVAVTGEWVELTLTAKGLTRHVPRLIATTAENGWFALCNVPPSGTIFLTASKGADSTDRIEVPVPTEGFVRRELYLGATRTVVVADTAHRADSLALPPRRMHVGNGRITGTVVGVTSGQPLAGAQVNIVDGPATRANDRGEWTLAEAPVGTRMLEVRAVGYYPERRRVDVIGGAPPVRVALSTLKAVLDTIRVTSTRIDLRLAGFNERSRGGPGKFLNAAEIARRAPMVASDLFRMIPGIRLDKDATDSTSITMRGGMDMTGHSCVPAIYLDGMQLYGISSDEIDGLVRAKDLVGLEIYSEATVPPQFQRPLSGCGSILMWTK